jgi:hypothetical protein
MRGNNVTARMLVGWDRRSINEASSAYVHIAGDEPIFKPLVTYLTALFGFAMMTEAYNKSGKGAFPWAMDDLAIFDAAACNVRLSWTPNWFLHCMALNTWPPTIDFVEYEAEPIPEGKPLGLGVTEQYFFGLGQFLITNFFEGQRPLIEERFGTVKHWPPVWNFARVVRNAMSHGGKVRITDGAEVRWQRLSYTQADNGKRIINTDIWPADLFMLVREMQKAVSKPSR